MSTPMRRIDMGEAREKLAAFEARCSTLRVTGQRLLARIRPSSKYYGQSTQGQLFAVVVACQGEYGVIGGPGGQYRMSDVDLFAVFSDDVEPIQLTFET